ncbi:MAG: XrtA-associated ATPase [Gammaproteobacteria bacterium]|nr:XrtA-associated ATPase [Gammaproteobacteria bacterium]
MYESFYGLNGSPFRLNPDPKFFFGSKIHNRALAYLRYGLNQKEGFIVVTGHPGTGKTTLARALLKDAAKERIVVSELNTTHLRADDVLRMVAASFGLEFEDVPKSTLLKRLETFLMSRHRAGYHALLLIDEAQNLPQDSLEELRMLSNFYTGNHALLQIFLLGQQQFKEVLYSEDMEQLRQRVVAACHLEPFDELETREYIEYRLSVVGWKQSPAISDQAFSLIYKFSEGVPRRINTFCERLFLFGSLESLDIIDEKAVNAVARELSSEVMGNSHRARKILEDMDTGLQEKAPTTGEQGTQSKGADAAQSEPAKKESKSEAAEKPQNTAALRLVRSNGALAKPVVQEVEPVVEPVLPKHEELIDLADQDWLDLVAKSCQAYNEPWNRDKIIDPKLPLQSGVDKLILVALGRLTVPAKFVASVLANASESRVRLACREFIKHYLLSPKSDYYRRLGILPSATLDEIKQNYQYLFRLFQPDQEQDPINWNESYTRRINQAYATLRDPDRRYKYDEYIGGLKTRSENFGSENANNESTSVIAPEPIKEKTAGSAVPSEKTSHSEASQSVFSEESKLPSFSARRENIQEEESEHKRRPVFTPHAREISAEPPSSGKGGMLWMIVAVAVSALAGGGYFAVSNGMIDLQGVKDEFSLEKAGLQPQAKQEKPEPATSPIVREDQESMEADAVKPSVLESTDLRKGREEVENSLALLEPPSSPIQDRESTKAKKSEPVTVRVINVTPKTVEPEIPVQPKEEPISVAPAATKKPEQDKNVQTQPPAVTEVETVASIQAPVLPAISRHDIDGLVNRLLFVYEGGDLEQLMGLFSESAVSNDSAKKGDIRRDYASLFRTTDMRVLELPNLSWDIRDRKAVGVGKFTVTVLKKGGLETRSFRGTMEIGLQKEGSQLLINRFMYRYDQ